MLALTPFPARIVEPLLDAAEIDSSGPDEFVLPLVNQVNSSALRKPVIRAIKLAGLNVWPKLFVARRASR
jgi:hypothetical protein